MLKELPQVIKCCLNKTADADFSPDISKCLSWKDIAALIQISPANYGFNQGWASARTHICDIRHHRIEGYRLQARVESM